MPIKLNQRREREEQQESAGNSRVPNMMHSGYCQEGGEGVQERIINVHRYTQVQLKHSEDESYELYRKNNGLIDLAQYATRPKSTLSCYPTAPSDPRYYTPSRPAFEYKPEHSPLLSEVQPKSRQTPVDSNRKALSKSIDLGKPTLPSRSIPDSVPVPVPVPPEADLVDVAAKAEVDAKPPVEGSAVEHVTAKAEDGAKVKPGQGQQRKVCRHDKTSGCSICVGCYNKGVATAREVRQKQDRAHEVQSRRETDLQFFQEVGKTRSHS